MKGFKSYLQKEADIHKNELNTWMHRVSESQFVEINTQAWSLYTNAYGWLKLEYLAQKENYGWMAMFILRNQEVTAYFKNVGPTNDPDIRAAKLIAARYSVDNNTVSYYMNRQNYITDTDWVMVGGKIVPGTTIYRMFNRAR